VNRTSEPDPIRRVHAPGRVNLIGDHTDYTGGWVFPMAIDRGITLDARVGGVAITLSSDHDAADGSADRVVTFDVPITDASGVEAIEPAWGRFVAAMAYRIGASTGIVGSLTSTIPAGAGLSSSAALECAVGLALGFGGSPTELAVAAREAEHLATGVPTGIMDQLCIASAQEGHATMIDCRSLEVVHVPILGGVDVVVEFVSHRTLVGSAYSDRVAECAAAESEIGPLREARLDDVAAIANEVTRRRARHVVTENERVLAFADALAADDIETAGALMVASHASLRDDFETSTAMMDDAVERLLTIDGVAGARITGGGFGGCVVALTRPGVLEEGPNRWIVRASRGAHVVEQR
jgi:galactokinase